MDEQSGSMFMGPPGGLKRLREIVPQEYLSGKNPTGKPIQPPTAPPTFVLQAERAARSNDLPRKLMGTPSLMLRQTNRTLQLALENNLLR